MSARGLQTLMATTLTDAQRKDLLLEARSRVNTRLMIADAVGFSAAI